MSAWGVKLGNAYISGGSTDTNIGTNPDCAVAEEDVTVVGCMTNPPIGMGHPGLRTEDITYFQRDGVRHFNDYYEPRTITIDKVMVCSNACDGGPSCSAREKLQALMLEWRRSCCDIELVVYTDCNGQYVEGTPILGQQTVRKNLIRNLSFEESMVHWSVPVDSFCRTYDRCYTGAGNTWCYSHVIDGVFTESIGTDGGWVGNNYMRLTCDTVPTNAGIGFTYAPSSSLSSPEVTPGAEYTVSAYLRASAAQDVAAQVLWFDSIGTLIGTTSGEVVAVTSTWTRVDVSAIAPDGVDYAHVQFVTTEVADWVVGGTLDIDGALFEESTELLDYFDGDSPDVNDPPVVGNQVVLNLWSGSVNNSVSYQSSQTYEENLDRSLYGPFGIVGRPRVAQVKWVGRGTTCAEVLLRFDATDQKMYVLDECGTAGYQQCRTLQPGLQQNCRTYDLCYTDEGGGRCYTGELSVTSVLPVTLNVGGTERVNPLIVLYPGLSYPTIENMESNETITFNGVVDGEEIMIDTENGIATGVTTGASYTHLLGGNIFLSILPGETQFRMYTGASQDTGEAAICWRDTVVSG